jgi:hypothetical protein
MTIVFVVGAKVKVDFSYRLDIQSNILMVGSF